MTLLWWRMTKKRLAKLAVLSGLRARSLRLASYISKAPTRGNTQRRTVARVLLPPNLPPPHLIVLSLPVSHYPVIQLSRLSVEVIVEQRRPRISLTLSLFPHLFPSSIRTKEVQHRIKRSGRSQGSLTRDKGKRAMNTRCAGNEHGCANGS